MGRLGLALVFVTVAGGAACADEPAPTALADATPIDAGELPPRPDAAPLDAADGGGTADAASPGEDAAPRDAALPSGDAGLAAQLVLPPVLALPYVVAGAGPSTLAVELENPGDAALAPLQLSLVGPDAPSFVLEDSPSTIPAHGRATLHLRWMGAATESIAHAVLAATHPGGTVATPIYAVAGAPALPVAAWEEVRGAGGVLAGHGVTLALPAAPFPHGGAPWTDASVRVFVPEGYRDLGGHDLVLHFHGWSTTLAETLAAHRYEDTWASGANAVLVVPQGPVAAESGDFGALMDPSGTARLLQEVLVVLYREGRTVYPVLDGVVLTSHSGGYQAVAANLDGTLPVRQIGLYDSLYGYASTFERYAIAGGRVRSDYTAGGGTREENVAVADALAQRGLSVATDLGLRTLRDAPVVIAFADTTHTGATRLGNVYGEALRFTIPHGRRGPRVELRTAVAAGGLATVSWLAPEDDLVTAWRVETSADGVLWATATEAPPAAATASFPLSGGTLVRVRARVAGLADADVQGSDVYRVDDGASVLVVDGFERVLGGGFGGLAHDFAARVGTAAGRVGSISHRALVEDGLDLAPWSVVIWCLGDQSSDDRTFTDAEQVLVTDYLAHGGRLVVSGSELAWDLVARGHGASFLTALGASYVADDSGSYVVSGRGPLSSLPTFGYAGPSAPYAVDWPDVLGAASGGTLVLAYADGRGAAAGIAGRSVAVGFPLEVIDDAATRAVVTQALLTFVAP